MWRLRVFGIFCGTFAVLGATVKPPVETFNRLPLRFEANMDRVGRGVKYIGKGPGYDVRLSATGISLRVGNAGPRTFMRFVGANRAAKIEGLDAQPTNANYYLGIDPSRWTTHATTWSKIQYHGLYPGTDLFFHEHDHALEYDFEVKPGGDPRAITLEFDWTSTLRVDAQGNLVLCAQTGEITWLKPVAYQGSGPSRRPIAAEFVVQAPNRASFAVADYDRSQTLVIDPVLGFSTFLGGNGNDYVRAIAVDSAGNIYITGGTSSTDLATSKSSYQSAFAGGSYVDLGDAFIAKLNPTASQILYITYFGGSNDDQGLGIAVDGSGSVYVTGPTGSLNFPVTQGAYQRTFGGSGGNHLPGCGDAFIAKFGPSGNLIYSTYLGGAADELGGSLAVDGSGNVYVAGTTLSANFPASASAPQKTFGGTANQFITGSGYPAYNTGDVFVAKLDPTGSTLLGATYLGGSGDEEPFALALDSSGNVYVAGATTSTNFPTTANAYQRTFGGHSDGTLQAINSLGDGFLAKYNSNLSSLLYSTYLGGNRDDSITSIFVDSTGSVYVGGATESTNFPVTTGAIQTTYRGPQALIGERSASTGDGFIARFNSTGSSLVFSTLLGGSDDDAVSGITVDSAGNIIVAGGTASADFPVTADALQKKLAGTVTQSISIGIGDAFVAKVDPAGAKLLYSSFLGGAAKDGALGIALDGAGNIYISGSTASSDFPVTTGVLQTTLNGQPSTTSDGFLAKITGLASVRGPLVTAVTNSGGYQTGAVAPGEIVTIFGTGLGPPQLSAAQLDSSGLRISNSNSGVQIFFDGIPAPVIYVSAFQASAVVPYEVAGHATTSVTVSYKGLVSPQFTVNVTTAVPGLFSSNSSGTGQGAILNQDGSLNSASNPAEEGSIVVLFGTGEGQTNPPGVDGQLALSVYPKPELSVAVFFDGTPAANVAYAGAAPTFVAGLLQVNAQLPPSIHAGAHQVVIKVGTVQSQAGLTVAVK